jgi:hypothetical protein
MYDWLWQADAGLMLGGLGFVTGLASLLYARNQARDARAQVKNSRLQAEEALRAAGLVADGAREQAVEALRAASLVAESAKQQAVEALRAAGLVAENARIQAVEALDAAELVAEGAKQQAVEALRAAGLVAESSREQAVEALRAAGLVAEGARQQAEQALRAAELLANSAVSARVREMRARNFRANPNLPAGIQAIIEQVGGPDAYAVMLDSMDVAQEIYLLRARGMVSDEHWRMWMNDQMVLIAQSPSFQEVFQRAADQGALQPEFVVAFTPVFGGKGILDPERANPSHLGSSDDAHRVPQPNGYAGSNGHSSPVKHHVAKRVAPSLMAEVDSPT